jgi:hypothetical protein
MGGLIMIYTDRIHGLNADAANAKYELFWMVVNELYAVADTVLNLLQGML